MDATSRSSVVYMTEPTSPCMKKEAKEKEPPQLLVTADTSSNNLKERFQKKAQAITPYTLEQCQTDAKGKKSWIIQNNSFSEAVLKEMKVWLNFKARQQEDVENLEKSFESVLEELKFLKTLQDAEKTLMDIEKDLKELSIQVKFALENKKTTLKLLGCEITAPAIENFLESDLKTLHIEQAILPTETCKAFEAKLGKNQELEALVLISVAVKPEDLDAIVKGLISQNENAKGVKNLYLVASHIDATYAKILKKLMAKVRHLKVLNLALNELGSGPSFLKPLRAKDDNSLEGCFDAINVQEESCCAKLAKKHPHSYKRALLYKYHNEAICALVAGAIKNREINGSLKRVIVASNNLTDKDAKLLSSPKSMKGSSCVHFNVAYHGLTKDKEALKLCYNSPSELINRNEVNFKPPINPIQKI